MKWMLGASVALVVFWIFWIEFGPGMGNVWLRLDASGERVFVPEGIWAVLIAPWKELAAGRAWPWWPAYWDTNLWVLLAILWLLLIIPLLYKTIPSPSKST